MMVAQFMQGTTNGPPSTRWFCFLVSRIFLLRKTRQVLRIPVPFRDRIPVPKQGARLVALDIRAQKDGPDLGPFFFVFAIISLEK
jgi:hypothetical protein